MYKKSQTNEWEVKQIKRNQQQYFVKQYSKNEMILARLLVIEKKIDDLQENLLISMNKLEETLSKKLEVSDKEQTESIKELRTDINRIEELVKILVANQLIDQI